MKKNVNFIGTLGLAAILLIAVSGLAAAQSKKTLVYCSEASPEGFSPQLYTSAATFDASANTIYNRLVDFKIGTTTIKPSLAESWDISPDGLLYTFKLRRGVKFHSNSYFTPTRDFNADDVVFTFDRMGNPQSPYHKLATGQTFAFYQQLGLEKIIDKVEKVDGETVRFTLKGAEAAFLANLAMPFASIYSKEYADKMLAKGDMSKIDTYPIGTGPFRFVSYQKDATIRYNAFDSYWAGRPKLDSLIFAITPDASARYAKLQANTCQVMSYPKPADLDAIKTNANINLISKPSVGDVPVRKNVLNFEIPAQYSFFFEGVDLAQ